MPRTFEQLFTSYTDDLASLHPGALAGDAGTGLELGIRRLVSARLRLREVIAPPRPCSTISSRTSMAGR